MTRVQSVAAAPQRPNQRRTGNQYSAASASATTRMAATGCPPPVTTAPFVPAFLLVAHGVAHLVGFVSSWKLATLAELPYKTTVFSGRVDVGDAGIRMMGVLWLLAALALLVAAITVASETGWAVRFTLA